MQLNIAKNGGYMKTKTKNYWEDLNQALSETFSSFGIYPTKYQKRDMAQFLIHVLESKEGISEIDLQFRLNFNDMRFLRMAEDLAKAGLIDREIRYERSDSDEKVFFIKPGEKISYLVRQNYHHSNNCCRKGSSIARKNDVETQEGSVSVITITDNREFQHDKPDIFQPFVEKNAIELNHKAKKKREHAPIIEIIDKKGVFGQENKVGIISATAKTGFPEKISNTMSGVTITYPEIIVPLIINKGHISEIREFLGEKGNTGTDVASIFRKWRLPYSEESVEKLKFYLKKNGVNFILTGKFPFQRLLGGTARENNN